MFGSKKQKEKIKEFEKQEKLAMLGASLGNAGAGLGALGRPGGERFGELVSEQAGSIASAASEGKAAAQEKMEKKAGTIGGIGRVLGAAVGSLTPLGPIGGAALGGALAGTAGYKAAGGENSALPQAAGYGIQSAIPGVLGKVLPGGPPGIPGGAPAPVPGAPGLDTPANMLSETIAAPVAGGALPAVAGQALPVADGAAPPQPGLWQRLGQNVVQQTMPRRRRLDPWGYGQQPYSNPNILSFGQGL